jgi:hypothetical protein
MLIKYAFLLNKASTNPVKIGISGIQEPPCQKSQIPDNQTLVVFVKISKIYLIFAAPEKWQSGRMRRS